MKYRHKTDYTDSGMRMYPWIEDHTSKAIDIGWHDSQRKSHRRKINTRGTYLNKNAGDVEKTDDIFNNSVADSASAPVSENVIRNNIQMLLESEADKEAFTDKFGKGSLERFQKLKDRFKNQDVSTDITWHVKNTTPEAMEKLLADTENKVVKDKSGKVKNNVIKVAENEYYTVYDVLDWQTSMNMGTGTGWCISDRYDTHGEVKPKQAIEFFNGYLDGTRGYRRVKSFLFCMPKNNKNSEKYCICLYLDGGFEIWNADDESAGKNKYVTASIPEFTYKGFTNKIATPKSNFIIENGLLKNWIGNIRNVVIPGSVIKIGDSAFRKCNLTSVTIPDSVTYIGDFAFSHNNLTSIVIPYSVTYIGAYAFYNNNLTSIVIPDSVTYIGDFAFSGNNLTSIVIPYSVTYIGAYAFYNNKLTSVTIPDSVIKIGDSAFRKCNLTSVTIPDSVTTIDIGAFENNHLTSVTIPDSVIKIGAYAFAENKLTSVTIPDSVVQIDGYAFAYNNLTSIVIPDSVTEIGDYAFYNNNLTSVTIPDSVTEIGYLAFEGNQLTSVTIPDSVTKIGSGVFDDNVTIICNHGSYAEEWATNDNYKIRYKR